MLWKSFQFQFALDGTCEVWCMWVFKSMCVRCSVYRLLQEWRNWGFLNVLASVVCIVCMGDVFSTICNDSYSLFTSLCNWWHMWVLMHVGFVVHVCTMINVCAGFCKNQGSESPKLFPAWSVLYMWAWPILVPTQNTMKEFSISIRTGWHMWGLMHVVFHVHVCSLFCVSTFAGMKKLGFPYCFGHLRLHCVHARCDLSWLT